MQGKREDSGREKSGKVGRQGGRESRERDRDDIIRMDNSTVEC